MSAHAAMSFTTHAQRPAVFRPGVPLPLIPYSHCCSLLDQLLLFFFIFLLLKSTYWNVNKFNCLFVNYMGVKQKSMFLPRLEPGTPLLIDRDGSPYTLELKFYYMIFKDGFKVSVN